MGPYEVVRRPLGAVWPVLHTGLGLVPISVGIPGLQGVELNTRKASVPSQEPSRAEL